MFQLLQLLEMEREAKESYQRKLEERNDLEDEMPSKAFMSPTVRAS